MTPQTEDCRAIVVKFVDAIGHGRLEDARSLLHDEFVAHAAAGVPYSGDYYGREEFLGSSPGSTVCSNSRRAQICSI